MCVLLRTKLASRVLSLFFIAALGCVSSRAIADDSAALTLNEALSRTLKSSPQLKLFPPQLREAEALELQANLRPEMEVFSSADNVLGSNDYRQGESAEYTLGLSQIIELGDKREKRLAVTAIQRANIAQEYELARLDILSETTRRFIEAAQAQQLLTLAQRQLANAQNAVSAAQYRAKAGAAANSDVSRMRIAVLQAELSRDRALTEVTTAKRKLAASWGASKIDFLQVNADLYAFEQLPSDTQLEERLATTPQLLKLLSEERLQDAQINLAESGAAADLNVGAGVKRFADTDDNALTFSFSMPLYAGSRNKGRVAEARAIKEKTVASRELADIEIRALFSQLWQQLLTQRHEATALKTKIVPAAAQVSVDIQRGYEEGRYSALDLLNANSELHELEKAAIESATAAHLQLVELERLTGQPLTEAGRFANTVEGSLP
jgi:cobalt-zinc-cadmium efflux system outer membrane protein